jgi:hypothetical protein
MSSVNINITITGGSRACCICGNIKSRFNDHPTCGQCYNIVMNERASKKARIYPSGVAMPFVAPADVLPEGHAGLAADAPAAGDVADAGLAADAPAADVPIDAEGHDVIAVDDPAAPHVINCMCRACLGGDDVPLDAEM